MSSSEKRSKQTRSSSFRKDRLILFLTGCALGVACFLWVYGAKIINPLYDAWLFNTDMDLKQHYIGWCHYRMSDWHFPVGLIDTLSYPTSVSVIYTDSIPILALVFKLFRNVLPQHFQYFGMFGLLSFMLMGGISSLGCRGLLQKCYNGEGDSASGCRLPSQSGDKESASDTPFPFINKNLEYIISVVASLIYILSFTVLQRMFYHTALGAQWIIVLALYIWVRRIYGDDCTLVSKEEIPKKAASAGETEVSEEVISAGEEIIGQTERTPDAGSIYSDDNGVTIKNVSENNRITLIYVLMGILSVGLHTYYVPMVGSVLLTASITHIIKLKQELTNRKSLIFTDRNVNSAPGEDNSNNTGKDNNDNNNNNLDKHNALVIRAASVRELVNLASFCLAGLLTLFVFGGFYGSSSGYGEGFGSFTSNLNTFINPIYGSIILKPMKLYYEWQYEGYGYLGAGVFLSILIIIAVFIYNEYTERKAGINGESAGLKEYIRIHPYRTAGAVLLAVDTALAVLPMVTFSDKKLFGIPMPEAVRSAFSIFRSNGRFIWVPVYLIMTGAVVYTYRLLSGLKPDMRKGKSILLKAMLLLVLIQVLDTTGVISEKQAYFKAEQVHTNIWAMAPFPAGDIRYREFVFLYNDNDIIMDTAFYAYLNGKCLNNYYYARNIDDEVNACINDWRKELHSGTVRDDVIYIFKKDDPLAEALRIWSEEEKNTSGAGADVRWYEIDNEHTVLVI